jgi:Ser/Thr protein kinase RdoA (MazF antagonist)
VTESRDFKRLVRERMAETGESYTVARAHFVAPPKKPKGVRRTRALPTTVAAFEKKVYGRKRADDLAAHIEREYGGSVSQTLELDVGVYRVDRTGEASWVARVFPEVRSLDAVRGDAEILAYLAESGFPAERLAHEQSVSVLAGQPVLVTEFVAGTNRRFDHSAETIECLGSLLGQLHTLPEGPGACARDAGGWHHLSVNGGGRRIDVGILLTLMKDAAKRTLDTTSMDEVRRALEELDDLDDLPKALLHPDPCGANLVAPDGVVGTLVDWTGAGRGPRVLGLAILIGSVRRLELVDAAVAGYRRYASLAAGELDRLEGALVGFPFVLDCWTMLFRGQSAAEVVHGLRTHRQRAASLARRAREAFARTNGNGNGTVDDKQATLF